MYDNNSKNEIKAEEPMNDEKPIGIILRELIVEFEEQLYSLKIQLKSQEDMLKEKELELAEKERTKVHNLDLFSPIYSKAYDNSEYVSMIERLKQRIETLQQEQRKINEKIQGLKEAIKCVDTCQELKDESQNEDETGRNKGLSILEAQEIERQRIARDLHDTTVQNLTSLVHKAELCIKLIDIDSIRAKLELNTMSSTLKMVINDMRIIIYNLKPMSLDDLGLTITVQRYAKRLMDLNNVQVKVTSNEETNSILPVIKLTLLRIIQEACTNVVKHARANLIDIDINYEESNITVIIKDNGTGFHVTNIEPSTNEYSSSFGLSIMKERISLLSGTMDIHSEEGKGTIVTVSVPILNHRGGKDE